MRHQPEEASTISQLIANKSVWQNTLILALTWTISSYSFYYCEFYLRLIPTNTIYLQKICMGFSDLAATLCYYYLNKFVGPVRAFKYLYSVLAIASLMLVITLAATGAEHSSEL